MRISDWSSDVCSSDLLLWDGKLPFQSSLSRSDGEVAARSADGGAMARGRCPSTIACGDGPPPHRFATGRIGRQPPAVFRPSAVQGDARPEEHTSEIQSLMRKYSAVFLLQKKT